MIKRERKQSQLDYLWVNFGERGVATSPDSATLDSIPSYGLVQELIDGLCAKAIGSVKQEGSTIVVKSIDGVVQNTIDLGSSSISIKEYGKRQIQQDDIDNRNCPYPLYQPVYYVKLSDDVELVAPIYTGGENNIIRNTILEGTIYSELKFSSSKIKGVVFSSEDDGLSGKVVFNNDPSKQLQFVILKDEEEYQNTVKDNHTLYFLKSQPYMYFGTNRIGSNADVDLSNLIDRVTNVEYLINWEENG